MRLRRAARGLALGELGVLLIAGLFGRWRLSDRWWLGAAVDHASDFDVERPYEFLGLEADPGLEEIDAVAESTSLTAWLEREYDRPGRLDWFWSVGAGASSVDVDDFAGPLAGGGSFEIVQEVGTELGGKTLGVLGFGRLGSRMARYGRAFDMKVLAFSRSITPERAAEHGAEAATSLEDLLARSDALSIHLTLNAGTRAMIASWAARACRASDSRARETNNAMLAPARTSSTVVAAFLIRSLAVGISCSRLDEAEGVPRPIAPNRLRSAAPP